MVLYGSILQQLNNAEGELQVCEIEKESRTD